MKTKRRVKFSFTILASLVILTVAIRNRADSPWPDKKPDPYTIIYQPETQYVEVDGFAGFAVLVHPATVATYQWLSNDVEIVGATNREFFFQQASVTNVAEYKVHVFWPGTNVMSSNAFLGVYSLKGGPGTSGTLTVPVRQFKPTSPKVLCAGVAMDKACELTNTAGVQYYFYGPFVPHYRTTKPTGNPNRPAEDQGPFANWTKNAYLKIDTIAANNAGTVTGIRLNDESDGAGSAVIDCKTGDSSTGPSIDFRNLSLEDKDPEKARYRVTIFYNGQSPQSGKIEMHWNYYR